MKVFKITEEQINTILSCIKDVKTEHGYFPAFILREQLEEIEASSQDEQ